MRRGQVSIFIIFGVLILLLVGVFLYFQSSAEGKDSSDNLRENLQAQFKGQRQAKGIVQQCIQDVVNEGVTILRLQGGFIDFPASAKTMYLQSNYEIYTEEGIKKVRENESYLRVPYYITAERGLSAPTLSYMEGQLATYVQDALPVCVGDLSAIQDEVKLDVQTGSVEADVSLEQSVLVKGRYLIKGRNNDIEWQIEDFSYGVPVRLDSLVGYAGSLATLELSENYLENHIKNIISLYSYGGEEKKEDDLPPFSHVAPNFDNQHVMWSENEAEQKLKTLLQENIPQLKIHGTRYNRSAADPAFVRQYFEEDNMTRIDFVYDKRWPADISIKPSSGGMLKPDALSFAGMPMIPLLSMFRYTFKYDIKIPVLVRIVDGESGHINPGTKLMDSQGTSFYFVMETYLCGNQNRRCNAPVNYSSFYNYSLEESEMYCDHMISDEVVINVTDSATGEPIPDAAVFYQCGTTSECMIGFTNATGKLESAFPNCMNGVLKVRQNTYGGIQNIVTINQDTHPGKVIDMRLPPLMDVTIQPKGFHIRNFMIFHYLTDGFTTDACDGRNATYLLESLRFNISSDDKLIVELEGINENLIKKTFLYPDIQNISLAAGDYKFTIAYIGNVSISPSTYGSGDSATKVGFEGDAPDYETYHGIWALGSSTYDGTLSITHNNATVNIFIPAEHAPTENLEVKDFNEMAIGEEYLNLTISADKDCNGAAEVINYIMPIEAYEPYVTPEIQ